MINKKDNPPNSKADLTESDELMRYLDLFRGILVATDEKNGIIYINKKGRSILGCKVDDVKKKDWFDVFVPKDLSEKVRFDFKRLGEEDKIAFTITYPVLCKEDEKKSIRWDNIVLRDESYNISLVLSLGEVASEKPREEMERDENLFQLLQSEKMESLARLTRYMTHDFKNTLLTVLGYSNMILEKSPEKEDIMKYVKRIKSAGDKASLLIEKLLLFSSVRTQSLAVVNLNSLIMKNLDLIKSILELNIRLELRLKDDLSDVLIDADQIEKVIIDIVINARDAIKGEGTLTIETNEIELLEGFRTVRESLIPGKYVKLSFKDSGIGMSEDVLDKIFEPFFTTKQEKEKKGLGLSIIFSIIKQHNGHIAVKSKINEGTSFEIYLPAFKD